MGKPPPGVVPDQDGILESQTSGMEEGLPEIADEGDQNQGKDPGAHDDGPGDLRGHLSQTHNGKDRHGGEKKGADDLAGLLPEGGPFRIEAFIGEDAYDDKGDPEPGDEIRECLDKRQGKPVAHQAGSGHIGDPEGEIEGHKVPGQEEESDQEPSSSDRKIPAKRHRIPSPFWSRSSG